jgi:dihydroorotate dehydrogenase (NAD+) catalytic subunit
MNAAGTLGFSPDPKSIEAFTRLGAFVTNPISYSPRTPAGGQRLIPFPGGFLLHTGYPNPGLKVVIKQHARRWVNAPIPVIVHLLGQEPAILRRMVEQLEGIEGVMGIEIGLPPDVDPATAYEMGLAAVGELVSIIRIPFESAAGTVQDFRLLDAVLETGASAVSLAPPRGTLPDSKGSPISGRLYGPGLFSQSLNTVMKLSEMHIPVIGAGGVYSLEQAEILLAGGATAVQLDAVLWKAGFRFSSNSIKGAPNLPDPENE